jgi:hypothetical protein
MKFLVLVPNSLVGKNFPKVKGKKKKNLPPTQNRWITALKHPTKCTEKGKWNQKDKREMLNCAFT